MPISDPILNSLLYTFCAPGNSFLYLPYVLVQTAMLLEPYKILIIPVLISNVITTPAFCDHFPLLFNQRKFQQPFPLQKPHKPLPSGTNMCSLSNLYDIHAQAAQPFCYV